MTELTLNHILTLSGRMDDEPRFDAPRERFRRFLVDYVRDVRTARNLIEQGQHAPSEQHQRAIQDLIVLCGRFLGFRTAFSSADIGACGHWQSPSHLHVFVDVRSDQTGVDDPALSAAARRLSVTDGSHPSALCVVTPLCMSRRKIDDAFGAAKGRFPATVVSLRSFLALVESVDAGRVSHDDLVRLLESNVSLDFIVDFFDRASVHTELDGHETSAAAREPMYWMCSVASDQDTPPEEFLQLVVAKRLIFGLGSDVPSAGDVHPGDGICFYVSGKGVVGHAHVAARADVGRGLRDAHRFRQVLQLERLHLHLTHPLAVDLETQLRVRTTRLTPDRRTQLLLEISRESFEGFVAGAISATASPQSVSGT